MDGFLVSTGLIFLAELGDKTQLVALALATRFRPLLVLGGIFCATLAVHLLSVALGSATTSFLPLSWVELASGLAFWIFGWWTWRGDCLEGDECHRGRFSSPFMVVAVTFFLAELGDKTMLSTVTIAASHPALVVWLGSTLGMVLSDGLAILVGKLLGRNLPQKAIRWGAAAVFLLVGTYYLYDAVFVLGLGG